MGEIDQLVEEIIAITKQYRAEVGSKRKPWPRAILERIERLTELGLTAKRSSDRTHVPYFSILKWRSDGRIKTKKDFHALAVLEKTSTVTVPRVFEQQIIESPEVVTKAVTVTVATPDGYQISSIDIESAILAIQKLRQL